MNDIATNGYMYNIYVARLICLLVYTQIIDRYELYYCIQLFQNGILKCALASLR